MTAGQFRRRTGGLTYTSHGRSGWSKYYVCTLPSGRTLRGYSVEYLATQVQQHIERTARELQPQEPVQTLGTVGVNMMGVSLV